MTKRKKVIRVLALVLASLLPLAIVCFWKCHSVPPKKPNPVPRGDYSYTVDYAEYRIRQLMRRHHLPSVAVALIDDQRVVWQETFGWADVEKRIPAESDTVYKLWSVAKVFTAIELMRLVEEGLVDLDAPITDYVPDFSIQTRFSDSEPITVRSILAHHSGLPRNSCCWPTPGSGNDKALANMVRSMKDGYIAFPVGSRFKYSNIGPDILGYTIQEFRDKSFAYYMEENLLDRIGMKNSSFLTADIPAQNDVAMGYEYYKGKYHPRRQDDVNGLPSGNLYSTIEDMGALVRFILRGGESNGKQIIRRGTLTKMFENQYPNERDPQLMGLGWKISGALGSELMVWHDGGPSEGIGSLVALLPERKLGVVLFANATSFDGSVSVPLAVELLGLMLETKYGVIPPADELPEAIEIDRSRLRDHVGRYIAFGQVMDVFVSGDRLKGTIQGMKLDMIPVGQNRFRVSHWLLKLGLANLLELPIDLRALEIEFLVGDKSAEDVMIINMGGVTCEVCPRYPDFAEIPALWKKLSGEYELFARLPSGSVGSDTIGRSRIWVEDGVLQNGGSVGPILPISETEIVILSGPFVGETMAYEPRTGNIYHGSVVFKPRKPD